MVNKFTKIKKTTLFKYIFLVLICLLFLKTDYRFKELQLGIVNDDHEYYYNVLTLVQDFDLDYSNQLNPELNGIYKFEDKIAPAHPIGNGFLGFPFLFLSNYLLDGANLSKFTSLNYFVYSLVPIVYLFFAIFLIKKCVKKNNFLFYISIFGSGITYYAFERFSMSIIYEFFAISLLIYLSHFSNEKKINLFLIGFLPSLFLLIRTSSYHFYLIPIFIIFLNHKKIILKLNYSLGLIFGLIFYSTISLSVYGVITFSPSTSFNASGLDYYKRLQGFTDISLLTENFLLIINTFKIVFFGMEFGLFYFSPILFLSPFVFYKLFSNNLKLLSFFYFFIFFIPFFQIIIVQNHGFSYGYRYLFNIIPLNVYLLFQNKDLARILKYYLLIFSINGIVSTLFFETTQASSLSTEITLNSFGTLDRYFNSTYLIGYFYSLFELNSYLKIFFTSFIGVIFLKIVNVFINPINFISAYKILNEKELDLIYKSINYETEYIFVLIILFFFCSYFLSERNNN